MALPKNTISSMVSYFMSMRIPNKDERALLIRIGTLIDAVIKQDRGLQNVGEDLDKRDLSSSRVPTPTGEFTEIVRGLHVLIDPVDYSGLAFYEVQTDTTEAFADPLTTRSYTSNIVQRGLTVGSTYYARVRAVGKEGETSPWASLGSIVVPAAADTLYEFGDLPATFAVVANNEILSGTMIKHSQAAVTVTANLTEDGSNVKTITSTSPSGTVNDANDNAAEAKEATVWFVPYNITTAGTFEYDTDDNVEPNSGIAIY